MNEGQLLAEIKTQLIAQTWTGSSNIVFPTGSVLITANVAEALKWALNSGLRTPIALIAPQGAESDPEHNEEPDWERFDIQVLLAVVVPGGAVGEEPVIGANTTGGSTQSQGQGIIVVEREFYNAVGKLNQLEGVILQIRQRGEEGGAFHPPSSYIAYRTYRLEAWGTAT